MEEHPDIISMDNGKVQHPIVKIYLTVSLGVHLFSGRGNIVPHLDMMVSVTYLQYIPLNKKPQSRINRRKKIQN